MVLAVEAELHLAIGALTKRLHHHILVHKGATLHRPSNKVSSYIKLAAFACITVDRGCPSTMSDPRREATFLRTLG